MDVFPVMVFILKTQPNQQNWIQLTEDQWLTDAFDHCIATYATLQEKK